MKLRTCPSCSHAVSPKAVTCPQCAHPLRQNASGLFVALLTGLVLGGVAWAVVTYVTQH